VAVAERLTPETPPTARPGVLKPPARVKLAYCFGQVVESSYLTIATFVFFYYTAVLGLPGKVVGSAVALSMVLDAVGDPFIGSWSDGIRSRFGRRLPLMLIGAPLTMITMGLLFSPPSGLSVVFMFLWLTLTKMGVRAFASVYNIPYFALGAELSDDYVERGRIVAYRLFAGLVVSTTVTALAYSVFFAGEGGLQRPDRYPAFGWTIGAGVLVGGLICCAGLWRFATALPHPTHTQSGMLRRLPGEVAEVFRNPSFRILFLTMLIFASAAGVSQALNNHAYVFVWKLRPEKIQLLAYVFLFGILIGTPLTPLLLRWVEKKAAAMLGFGLVFLSWIGLPTVRALGLFAPTGDAAMTWLAPTLLGVGIGTGMIFIAYPAMMADAADEHEHVQGSRREALYFAGLSFAGKAAAGVGTFIGGFALDGLHFPREAGRDVHAVVAEPVLRGLTATWALLPAALCVVGVLALLPYAISRSRHAEIAAAIRSRRALEADV
jgi:GPH family glycoside/pentoside/hexuronide:cation symporter